MDEAGPLGSAGATPLLWALETGSVVAVAALLRHGADPTRRSPAYGTPLEYMARSQSRHAQELRKLLEDAIRERSAGASRIP